MMKIRYIPFGYKYENGQKVINEKESVAVIEIFTRYLKREGVMAIANDLTERRIEYMPNEFEWNKSRVLRVVKDARYIGENKFPSIIDKPTFNAVRALYNEKRTVTENFLDKDVHRILIPVKCPECGGIMKRRCDCRRKNHEKWYCQNKDCKKVITIKDDAFIKRLIDILNELIEKSGGIEYSLREDFSGGELPAMKNEIENLFINPSKNEEKIREKINEYFSEIYNKADKNTGKTMRIKTALKNVAPQTEFSPKLLSSVAEVIKLYSDGEVGIILINGSEIRR